MANPEKPTVEKTAVKAIIMNRQGRILILREAAEGEDNTQPGRWQLPGGRHDEAKDKTPWDTLYREVGEETGLTVEPVRVVYSGEWGPTINNVKHRIVGDFVLCRLVEGELVLSEEHDGARFINPGERTQFDVMPPDDLAIDAMAGISVEEVFAAPRLSEDTPLGMGRTPA